MFCFLFNPANVDGLLDVAKHRAQQSRRLVTLRGLKSLLRHQILDGLRGLDLKRDIVREGAEEALARLDLEVGNLSVLRALARNCVLVAPIVLSRAIVPVICRRRIKFKDSRVHPLNVIVLLRASIH